jgi:hypothetical protein
MGYAEKCVQVIRNDYSSVNVTTSAYVQLDDALNHDVRGISAFDSSGKTLKLALGASGSEVDIPHYIPPGGTDGVVPIKASRGDRLSIRAVDATASSGVIILNLFA